MLESDIIKYTVYMTLIPRKSASLELFTQQGDMILERMGSSTFKLESRKSGKSLS